MKIGHRGACGYEAENSPRSFTKTIELNADMVEFDVQICKSGELIVFHDETLKRTTDGFGKISEKTLSELKNLKLSNGENIPTLEEALDLIDKRVSVNIELKGKKTAGPTYEIISRYISEKKWPKDFFYLSSFSKKEIKDFRKIDKGFKVSYILSKRRIGMHCFAEKNHLYSLNVQYNSIDEKLISKAHRKGLQVFAWTVNEKEDIGKMKSLGVDGIISDYPDRI